jgi:mannose-6-phosphate isomerase-like protein (cupin superfamily)
MINKITYSEKDKKSIALTKVDSKTQIDDFFDYSKVVVKKPWGYEYLAFQNTNVAVWILYIKNDQETSMHCHPHKKTVLVLLSGKVHFVTLNSKRELSPGDACTIEKGVFHQTKSFAKEGSYVMEIETPVNKRDLVRLKDKYGRKNLGYEDKNHMSYNLTNYNHFSFQGPEIYYDAKKKFGDTGVILGQCDNDKLFRDKISEIQPDLAVILKGNFLNAAGSIIAGPGDAIELAQNIIAINAENKLTYFPEGGEYLLIKNKDTMIRLSDYVINWLEKSGIQCAFIVSGQLNTHLLDSIGKNNKIAYLFTHHEQACVMAAGAYAKITNKPAMCIISSGASSTNALTGVLGAWIDSVPCIIISGNTSKIGRAHV